MEQNLIEEIQKAEQKPSFLSRRRSHMDTIRSSLQAIPLFKKNHEMVDSKLRSEHSSSSEKHQHCQGEIGSDHVLSQDEPLEVFEEKYEVMEKLGEGSSGVVHRCLKRSTGEVYAAKSFVFEDQHVLGLKDNFLNQKQLVHEHIITYEALYLDMKKHQGWLVMEYISWPELNQVRLKGQDQLRFIMQQILQTLDYLHKNKIVHRDIKPENVLYCQKKKSIKLIDFGIARKFRRRGILTDMWTITGTLFYRAPEMFAGGYREGIDVWAAAILLFKMVSGDTPFQSHYHHETIKKIAEAELTLPPIFDSYSSQMKSLLKRMLHRNIQERPSAFTCLKDMWFYPIPCHRSQQTGSLGQIQEYDSIFENDRVQIRKRMSSQTTRSLQDIPNQISQCSLITIQVGSPNCFVSLKHKTGEAVYCIDSEKENILIPKPICKKHKTLKEFV